MVESYPIPSMIVGRNSENEYMGIKIKKKLNDMRSVFTLRIAKRTYNNVVSGITNVLVGENVTYSRPAELLFFYLLRIRCTLEVHAKSMCSYMLFLLCEEAGRAWRVGKEEECSNGDYDRDRAFDEEDPWPVSGSMQWLAEPQSSPHF